MSYIVSLCSCVFSVLLALRLPCLGKREIILVLFVCLFDLCLFGFVGFLFLLVSWKGCFFVIVALPELFSYLFFFIVIMSRHFNVYFTTCCDHIYLRVFDFLLNLAENGLVI